jgi:SAM-dependent methyltransferase
MEALLTRQTPSPRQADRALLDNRRTVESYERCARDYANATAPQPSSRGEGALRRLLDAASPGETVLEIGSGPGWDADFLETHGLVVRRTDITEAFLQFQAERGKHAERLDLISDDLGGPYGGIAALYVLQHIDRALIDAVLRKVSNALRPGGAFLVALREGTGEFYEQGSAGIYHIVLWTQAEFEDRLAAAGLLVEWCARASDEDGHWLTLFASKTN